MRSRSRKRSSSRSRWLTVSSGSGAELTTKTGVSSALRDLASGAGFVPGSMLDGVERSGDASYMFAFPGPRLPREIVVLLEGEPVRVRSMFTANTPHGGGFDAMAEHGGEWLVSAARDLALNGAGSAHDALSAMAEGSPDARAGMVSAIHELRGQVGSLQLSPVELIAESELCDGGHFLIAGHDFVIYTDRGTLRAAGAGLDFNLDQVGSLPADAGTYDASAGMDRESILPDLPF